jgi:hypothetical protein
MREMATAGATNIGCAEKLGRPLASVVEKAADLGIKVRSRGAGF